MADPQERYCSSYYDKHGLYNDGFPCPQDKYCCTNDDDGHKMCCLLSSSTEPNQRRLLDKGKLNHKQHKEQSVLSYSK